MWRIVVLAGVLGAASAFGLWWRARNGRMTDPVLDAGSAAIAALGIEPAAAHVTLVQFSSAFCQPCRATRAILADVAGMVPGVAHVEVDAEQHLDAVRALDIRRTPTVLVVDRTGRIVQRASGQPRKADVIAAIGPHIPDSETTLPDSGTLGA
jgi:thiol-disulfide isomerase/thioredoxin